VQGHSLRDMLDIPVKLSEDVPFCLFQSPAVEVT